MLFTKKDLDSGAKLDKDGKDMKADIFSQIHQVGFSNVEHRKIASAQETASR